MTEAAEVRSKYAINVPGNGRSTQYKEQAVWAGTLYVCLRVQHIRMKQWAFS